MASKVVHVGTIGRTIELDTEVDLTEFVGQLMEFLVRLPDNTETTWEATPKDDDPTTKILVHQLQLGDVDQPGSYMLHTHVQNALKNLVGDVTELKVLELYQTKK